MITNANTPKNLTFFSFFFKNFFSLFFFLFLFFENNVDGGM